MFAVFPSNLSADDISGSAGLGGQLAGYLGSVQVNQYMLRYW